jgi:hypothetical protein
MDFEWFDIFHPNGPLLGKKRGGDDDSLWSKRETYPEERSVKWEMGL